MCNFLFPYFFDNTVLLCVTSCCCELIKTGMGAILYLTVILYLQLYLPVSVCVCVCVYIYIVCIYIYIYIYIYVYTHTQSIFCTDFAYTRWFKYDRD